jgi:hypothetical protein
MQTTGDRQEAVTWADRAHARIRQQLGPRWEIWFVPTPYDPAGRYFWSARPAGAEIATSVKRTPDDLLEAVREYVKDLPEHIEDTRRRLEAPDLTEAQRRVLRALLAALLHLQEAQA